MRKGMLKIYSAITISAMALSMAPMVPALALSGNNEISLINATQGGTLGATLTCGDVDLLTVDNPAITYGDQIICDLSWVIPNDFSLTTDDVLIYNLPEVIEFEDKSGDIFDGNNDIGDYEIAGNQIRLNYTSEDFCVEESRHGHLAFSGSAERNPDGSLDPADIVFSFEGIADITVHIEPPVTEARLTVDKVFHVVDEAEHIYSCWIPITATGAQTGIVVRDTMWPGMELYGGYPTIYADAAYTTVFTDHTDFVTEEGDGRSFSCTINNLADGQTVYMLYNVKVNDAMYDSVAGNEYVTSAGFSGPDNYYPTGYEGTIPNRITVRSNEAPTPVSKITDIYGSGYSFVKWYSRPIGDELNHGYLRWQLYINKINNNLVDSGYIIDTIPENNSFDPANVIVYSGDDYHGYNITDYVTITTQTADGQTQIRFEFTPAMISELKSVANGIYIEYTTHVEQQATSEAHYVNNATLYYNGVPNSSRMADTYYTKPNELDKTGIYNASTAPYANYTITVNPAALELNPYSDTVTLTDTMGSALDLDVSSVRVNGVAPSSEDLTYNPSTHQFTLNLDDETSYVVTYRAAVNLVEGETLDATNAVNACELTGVASTDGSGSYTIRSRVYNNSASSSSSIGRATLNIIKHDSESVSNVLEGASFTVSEAVLDSGNNVTSASAFASGATDASGRISNSTLTRGVCYMVEETQAPEGYELNAAPVFIIFSESSSASYPSTVSYNGTVHPVIVVSNTRASYDLYLANDLAQTVPEEDPTEPSESTEPAPSTSETTTAPSVDVTTTTTTAATTVTEATTTTSATEATVATTTTATTTTVTTAAATTTPTTTAPSDSSAAVLGATRLPNEAADPTTSASADETSVAQAPTPTPASGVANTGEENNHTAVIGMAVLAAASLCFVFYVRSRKQY